MTRLERKGARCLLLAAVLGLLAGYVHGRHDVQVAREAKAGYSAAAESGVK